jgi:hypothetical protein
MAIGLLDLLGGYLGGLAVEETAKQTGIEDALRPRMQKVVQGAKDLGSDALDFFIPSASADAATSGSTTAPGFMPNQTDLQNTPIQSIPEVMTPSPDWTGAGRGVYQRPQSPADWTGEGRGIFDPARMSDREISIEEEAMQTASDLLQMGGTSMADVGKKAAVEAATGEGPGFLSAIQNFIGDEEKMLTLAQAFNTMRTNRDDQLGSFIGKRLETLRGAKGSSSTIQYLRDRGRNDLADAVQSGTITAKEALTLSKPTSLEEKMALFQSNPELAAKMGQLGLFGGNVDMGTGKWWDKLAEYTTKQIEEYNSAGGAAVNLGNELDNISRVLAAIGETGPTEQTAGQLQQFFKGYGIDLGLADLGNVQALEAATRRLVAQELRLNKGPQTDFDAKYAESYIPSLGKTRRANERMLDHMRSSNSLKKIWAKMARKASLAESPQQARAIVNNIDDMASQTPAVVKKKDGSWISFNEFSNLPEARGMTNEDILQEWVDFYKEEGGY